MYLIGDWCMMYDVPQHDIDGTDEGTPLPVEDVEAIAVENSTKKPNKGENNPNRR